MIFYKWYCRNWFPGFHKKFYFPVKNHLFQTDGIGWFIITNKFTPYFCIAVKIKRGSYHKAKHNLTEHFEPACQSILIPFFIMDSLLLRYSLGTKFQVVIDKSDHAHPECTEDHQAYVSFIQVGK